jgi:hypothetical protein
MPPCRNTVKGDLWGVFWMRARGSRETWVRCVRMCVFPSQVEASETSPGMKIGTRRVWWVLRGLLHSSSGSSSYWDTTESFKQNSGCCEQLLLPECDFLEGKATAFTLTLYAWLEKDCNFVLFNLIIIHYWAIQLRCRLWLVISCMEIKTIYYKSTKRIQVLPLASEICSAMAYLHEHGITHGKEWGRWITQIQSIQAKQEFEICSADAYLHEHGITNGKEWGRWTTQVQSI